MISPPSSTHSASSCQNPLTSAPNPPRSQRLHPAWADMAAHQYEESPEKRRRITASSNRAAAPAAATNSSSADTSNSPASQPPHQPRPEGPSPLRQDRNLETASLTDSARAHSYENGLRYHGYRPGSYAFPNDETEQERDQLAHRLSYELCDGQWFLAPINDRLKQGAHVLDLGTGIGIWCEELADSFPRSFFEGIDLSPIQSSEVPPNVSFYVDDMEHEQGWDFEGQKFDYIHLRHTLHSVRNRPELLKRVYDHLKPGGYFEVQEMECLASCDDGSAPEGRDYALTTWFDTLAAGLRARGADLYGIRAIASEMRAAGFESVVEKERKCPVGAWPADPQLRFCGGLLAESILSGLRGLSARPFAALGWTQTQIEMFLVGVRDHVKNSAFHTHIPFRTVYGHKPTM